jgi:hypothetical protein
VLRCSKLNVMAALTRLFGSLMLSVVAHAAPLVPLASSSDVAQLFSDPQHAAAGTCFPKYHLELWRNEDAALQELSTRASPVAPLDVPHCPTKAEPWPKLREYFRAGIRDKDGRWKRPQLAVTLEGGGSKAAPFAMGALAGLHQAGLLNNVDIISSVSGGGYAAYFYFSRLLDVHHGGAVQQTDHIGAWFKDCVPSVHRSHFAKGVLGNGRFCNPETAPLKFVVENTPRLDGETVEQHTQRIKALNKYYYANDNIEAFAKAVPFQSHVRFYQDVAYPRGGMRRVGEGFKDGFATWANVALLGLLQVATVPLHTVMNTAVSMPENTSPSRFAYRAGIERAYGHSATSWGGASVGDGRAEKVGGEWTESVYSRRHSLARIFHSYPNGPPPARSTTFYAPTQAQPAT